MCGKLIYYCIKSRWKRQLAVDKVFYIAIGLRPLGEWAGDIRAALDLRVRTRIHTWHGVNIAVLVGAYAIFLPFQDGVRELKAEIFSNSNFEQLLVMQLMRAVDI